MNTFYALLNLSKNLSTLNILSKMLMYLSIKCKKKFMYLHVFIKRFGVRYDTRVII